MIPISINVTSHIDTDRPQDLERAVRRVIAWAADKLEKEEKRIVPVKTGRLKKSIEQKAIPGGRSVAPDTEYDIYVEFGTSRMGAQPYVRPAVKVSEKLIPERLAKEVRAVLE